MPGPPPVQESAPLAKKGEGAPLPPKTIVTEEEGEEDFYAGLEGEYFEAEEESKKTSSATEPRRTTSKTKTPDSPPPVPVERMKTEKVRPIKSTEPLEEPVTSKTDLKEETPSLSSKTAPKSAAGMGFDDSISSILRSIPLEDEEEEAKPQPVEAKTPVAEKEEEPPSITHVEDQPSKPVLICIEGELDPSEIQLGENTSMGRSPSNDIVLKEAKVSRQHAAINFLHGDYVLVDLKSSNGVFVNGQKIEEHVLKDGDEISVGSFRLLYRSQA
jgi:predicted component of type VI protein secretion system